MDAIVTTLVDGILVPLVDLIVVPFGNAVPLLASTGILLLVFGALWVAFGAALVRDPARLDDLWRRIRALPLLVQAGAWLLFLPVLAGLWVWRTSWPRAARLALIGGLAGWNLLMFMPMAA